MFHARVPTVASLPERAARPYRADMEHTQDIAIMSPHETQTPEVQLDTASDRQVLETQAVGEKEEYYIYYT